MPETSAQVLLVYVLSSRTKKISKARYGQGVAYVLTLVAQHQRYSEEPEFTAQFTFDSRIELLESIDEHQSQKYDIL